MKPEVKFALCYPSGTGGMFLTELIHETSIEESGQYKTNPGCYRSEKFNEYGGSLHNVWVDNTTEAREVTKDTILCAKTNIHKYLPFYNCPITYQIDCSDDYDWEYTQTLMFIKKHLGAQKTVKVTPTMKAEKDVLVWADINSQIFWNWCAERDKTPHLYTDFSEFVRQLYAKMLEDSRPAKSIAKDWDISHKRYIGYDLEKIKEHSPVQVIKYGELFFEGRSGTVFDTFSKEIEEYTNRNDELIEKFKKTFL